MKIVRYGIFFSSVAVAGAIVVARPDWLASNTFIQALVGPDLLSLLVVILTITFASVANIHLSLNRFLVNAPASRRQAILDIRSEINSNAWMIFTAFVVCVIALLAKGAAAGNATGLAAADSVCLLVLLVNALGMHDLYHAIFALASANAPTPNGVENEQPDYTQDSPPAG